jgi:hypothetical protein
VPQPATVARDDAGELQAVDGRPVETTGERWRVDDEWWRQPISRRYLEAILAGGARVVVFEDLITGAWFVQQP